MKKSEVIRSVVAAVVCGEMEFPDMFEALDFLFSEYRTAVMIEDREEKK